MARLAPALLLLLAFGAVARAVTVSDFVGTLCPKIVKELTDPEGEFTTLNAALTAVGDEEVEAPKGNVTIVAPNDNAFKAVLSSTNKTAEELLADKKTLLSILALHIIGDETALSGGAADIGADSVDVKGSTGPVRVTAGPACDGQTVLVANKVIMPAGAAEPTEGPSSAPAPGPSGAGITTVGALVDALCPQIKTALEGPDFTTLNSAIKSLASTPIDIPAGEEVSLVAPTNAAFASIIASLGAQAGAALANPQALGTILKEHILTGPADEIMTLNGNMAEIDEDAKTIDIEETLEPVKFTDTLKCDGQTAFVASSVVVPQAIFDSLAPKPAPAPKPVMPPMVIPKPSVKPIIPTPAPAPISSASSSTFVVAAGVAMVAGLLA